MSEARINAVRGVYTAFNARDADEAVAIVSPEFAFVSEFAALFGRHYSGHGGFRRYFSDLADVFASFEVELREVEAIGDCVLVAYREHAVGRGSGIEIIAEGFELWRFDKQGRPLGFENHETREGAVGAISAAG